MLVVKFGVRLTGCGLMFVVNFVGGVWLSDCGQLSLGGVA